ncbi:MAG: nucleotidyltransferase domain-containing protein [bacterium]
MPLGENEKEAIIRISKEYGVKKVWLFGSMLEPEPETAPNDVDLAVEGLPKGEFINFYVALEKALPMEIDLVPLDEDPPISVIVRKKGRVIYG